MKKFFLISQLWIELDIFPIKCRRVISALAAVEIFSIARFSDLSGQQIEIFKNDARLLEGLRGICGFHRTFYHRGQWVPFDFEAFLGKIFYDGTIPAFVYFEFNPNMLPVV